MARDEHAVAGIDVAHLERIVGRLLEYEPQSSAVLVTGSFAKGTAATGSDLDLTAITAHPRTGYRTWFEDTGEGLPLHVSAGAMTIAAWVADGTTPASWSLGLPAQTTARYVLSDAATRAVLGVDPSLCHPAAGPELEDFVDFVLKAKRTAGRGDERGTRWLAREAALLAPTLLIPLNDSPVVHDRLEALELALSLPISPDGYADDLAICLGLRVAVRSDVDAAVARLGRNMLAFLRRHDVTVDPQPDLSRYLADGTLERHLAQLD